MVYGKASKPSRGSRRRDERNITAKEMDKQKEKSQEYTQHDKKRRGRPVAEILRDEQSQEDTGKSKEEESKKKPRWRDSAPPIIERPSRARKAIERFGSVPEKESPRAETEILVMKGNGMALKDIPNVVYKLGKLSKTDNILVLLHTLLYGKRTKVNHMKSNILSFSGYVWGENKEKEEKKVKERLERLTRDGLYELIDLLDIQISRSSSKKELVEEGFRFLLAPKTTRDTSLQEQEQKSTEEPSKVKEREDKGKKGVKKSYQKKVLKDKDAPKRKREKRSKNAEDKGSVGSGEKGINSEKGIKEKQKPSKRSKKSLDEDKQKKDQSALEKMKEMDEAADDEELIEEEEPTVGRTYLHTNEGGSDKGGDANVENVNTESLVEKVEGEKDEGICKDAPVEETGGKDKGTCEDASLDETGEQDKVNHENAPRNEIGEKYDDEAIVDSDLHEEDKATMNESSSLECEAKENVTDRNGLLSEEEIKAEERSFLASVQDYNRETEEPFLGFFGENSEENGGLLELPENEIELGGQDVSSLIPERVEITRKVSQSGDENGEITADSIKHAMECDTNSLGELEVHVSDYCDVNQKGQITVNQKGQITVT